MSSHINRFYLEDWLAAHASSLALDDKGDQRKLAQLLLSAFELTLRVPQRRLCSSCSNGLPELCKMAPPCNQGKP